MDFLSSNRSDKIVFVYDKPRTIHYFYHIARESAFTVTRIYIDSMSAFQDPLVHLPATEWIKIKSVFQSDWPRGISGYTILETQEKWSKNGFDYGFKVFCPFGEAWNGMVAVNQKNLSYEVVIQCPKDDTTKLKEALICTHEIDWNKDIVIPFAPQHIIECIKDVVNEKKLNIKLILPSESFILEKGSSLFEVSLPPSITFDLLTPDHVDIVNSTWPHRYPGSEWYFQLLIKTQSGYGLFEDKSLISWVLINEAGTLSHMYTVESSRRKGYAKLLLKLICNKLLKDDKDVFVFALKGNENACSLYRAVGFKKFDGVAWCFINGK